jgi:hypothetical protein
MSASVSRADAGTEALVANPARSGAEAGTVSDGLSASSASAEETAMASAAYLAGVGWEPSLAQRLSRQVEQELRQTPQPSRATLIYEDLLKQREASRERAESVAAQAPAEGVAVARAREVQAAETVETVGASAPAVSARSMATTSASWLLGAALAGLTALVAASLGLLLRGIRRQRPGDRDRTAYATADTDAFGDGQEDALESGSLFEVSMVAPRTPVRAAERSRVHFLKRQEPSKVPPAPVPSKESPAHNPRRAAASPGAMPAAGQPRHAGPGGMPAYPMSRGPNIVYVPVPVAAIPVGPAAFR